MGQKSVFREYFEALLIAVIFATFIDNNDRMIVVQYVDSSTYKPLANPK